MDLNTLIDELEKCRGWLGGGNPEVQIENWNISNTKVRNGLVEIVLDDSGGLMDAANTESEEIIDTANEEARRIEDAANDAVQDAKHALQEALDKLNNL